MSSHPMDLSVYAKSSSSSLLLSISVNQFSESIRLNFRFCSTCLFFQRLFQTRQGCPIKAQRKIIWRLVKEVLYKQPNQQCQSTDGISGTVCLVIIYFCSLSCVRFPPVASSDTAAVAAPSLISPVLMSATARAQCRHSSESDVDTPPKVEQAPFFETSPKGFSRNNLLSIPALLLLI